MKTMLNCLRRTLSVGVVWGVGVAAVLSAAEPPARWQIGRPIVTYWAGPPLSDATARQMAEGGWNLVWCGEQELDTAQRHGLRAMLQDGLLAPASLDNPEKRAKLDALIERVRKHPACYAYFLTDEPSAAAFPAWGRLVAYLRERDPGRLAYINLFPTYASNEQLGTPRRHGHGLPGTSAPVHGAGQAGAGQLRPLPFQHARRQRPVLPEHRPDPADGPGAGVPFLNIVQACTWTPSMRVPERR